VAEAAADMQTASSWLMCEAQHPAHIQMTYHNNGSKDICGAGGGSSNYVVAPVLQGVCCQTFHILSCLLRNRKVLEGAPDSILDLQLVYFKYAAGEAQACFSCLMQGNQTSNETMTQHPDHKPGMLC
jgi:hypothetical protein